MQENNFPDRPLWDGYRRVGEPAAVHSCYYQCASNDPGIPQLWAYTDSQSYAPGSVVRLHVSTTSETFNILIYRDGATKKEVFEKHQVKGDFHETSLDCSIRGCNWPVSFEFTIDENWASGGYVVELSAMVAEGSDLEYHHLFILRPGEGSKRGRILLAAAVGTWTAYNDWGGSNHYEGITGEHKDQFSPILSLNRPYARGFVTLPNNAPRIPLREVPEMGAAIRYPHMEWAFENGYSKKFASAGWASYERLYVHWLEDAGYTIDIISEQDLQLNPRIVDEYDCITLIGHSEYWTWEMRDTVDAYVKNGGNIARFAGNFFWQTRLQDKGCTQICYKYNARQKDPFYTTEKSHLTTICWDAPETGRPGAQTFGLSGTQGLYASWGGCSPRGAGGFTVYRPDHWVFRGSDIYYGDVLGARSRVLGYEVDGVDYIIKGGLPYSTGTDGAPKNLLILAVGLSSLEEADHNNGLPLFIGSDDSEFVAHTLQGNTAPVALEKHRRGAGMISIFESGRGCVFNAGTCEWVSGLKDHDPQIEQITRNVLDQFLK